MTKATHIKVGGSWKQVNNVWQKVNGGWVGEVMPHVKVNGEYKECMSYAPDLAIGDEYGGGIVAYLGSEGDFENGMIAAPSDISTSAIWGCRGTTIGGDALATAIGTGKAATAAIVAGCAESGIAARLCNDSTLNGYDDWFLPSIDELSQIYQNKDAIGGFANHNYWSSSESHENTAWSIHFGNGSTSRYYSKNNSVGVRPVRGF